MQGRWPAPGSGNVPTSDLRGLVWSVCHRKASSPSCGRSHLCWQLFRSSKASGLKPSGTLLIRCFPVVFGSGSGPSNFFPLTVSFGVLKYVYSTGRRLWEVVKTL